VKTHKRNQIAGHFMRLILSIVVSFTATGQTTSGSTATGEWTLPAAIAYALEKQPLVQQDLIDERITAAQVRTKLADWYPQVNFNYNLQHNFLLPTSLFAGNIVRIGSANTSGAQFTASQNLFNRDALLAMRTRENVKLQSRQATASDKIDLAVNVSKAFYDVLATMQQIRIATANIERVTRSLKDAVDQYEAGVADKIDFKRATILLNNTKAFKIGNENLLKARLATLKSLMNFPENKELNIVFDSLQMEKEVVFDAGQTVDYHARIEYKQLETQRNLLAEYVRYNRWSYLPTIAANGGYNLNYLNNDAALLYNKSFPASYAGVTLGLPIFQGGKRKENTSIAQLALERNELDIVSFKLTVDAAYEYALSVYKSNLTNYLALKENVVLAKEVYDVIDLQYKAGIKTYLEVIIAENDLRTAQINYYTALYQLLSSKIDVQKSLGQINY
jgi:outer membrane protein